MNQVNHTEESSQLSLTDDIEESHDVVKPLMKVGERVPTDDFTDSYDDFESSASHKISMGQEKKNSARGDSQKDSMELSREFQYGESSEEPKIEAKHDPITKRSKSPKSKPKDESEDSYDISGSLYQSSLSKQKQSLD